VSARRHGLAALLAVGALVLLLVPFTFTVSASAQGDRTGGDEETSAPAATVTVTQTVTAEPEPEGAFEVDDAQLRWGVNDETNNKAFAPNTFNFLSAGKVPDPGRGGQTIVGTGTWIDTSKRAWFARNGDVRVEKQRPDGSYGLASFAGLRTTVAGTPMSGTNGPFSGHQVVLDGGTGEVDLDAGTATIRWSGSFSVVYYSGMTFFTVTDPVLTVTPTGSRLTATLGGYASSMDDQSRWTKVPDRSGVVLADLPTVELTDADGGFSAEPRYRGVIHTAPSGGSPQVRTGEHWGSFPRSFLAFMGTVGSGSYWYSSGGSADAHKVPAPVTVSYEAGAPVTPPTDPGTDDPDPTTGPSASPTTSVNPTPPPAIVQPPGPSLPAQPVASDAPAPAPPAADGVPVALPGQPGAVPTTYALASSEATTPTGPGSESRWQWWLGSVLLLGAAALTLIGQRMTRQKGRP
jgi:hypothetical protein